MSGSKLFRALVVTGAALTLGEMGCGSSGGTPDAGSIPDAGSTPDAGPVADAGCSCHADPSWPGQDCGPAGGTFVCCWLNATAACCP